MVLELTGYSGGLKIRRWVTTMRVRAPLPVALESLICQGSSGIKRVRSKKVMRS